MGGIAPAEGGVSPSASGTAGPSRAARTEGATAGASELVSMTPLLAKENTCGSLGRRASAASRSFTRISRLARAESSPTGVAIAMAVYGIRTPTLANRKPVLGSTTSSDGDYAARQARAKRCSAITRTSAKIITTGPEGAVGLTTAREAPIASTITAEGS